MQEMTSLERYMAAINGEPMDMYPALNVSPNWSMMPHWPEVLGLNFLHLSHGTDEQRLKFYDVLHDDLGLDYIPCGGGKAYGQRGKQYVTEEDGVPVLVDIGSRSKTRYHEFPPDLPPDEPLFETAADVERLEPPPTAEELLASGAYDFTKKLIEHFDDTVFLYMGDMAPFPTSFYMLSYDKLFDAMFFQKDLVFALMDRHEEVIKQQCRLARMLGVHGYQLMQWFASADMISDDHYVEFALPGEIKAFQYIHDEGLTSSMALMGWIEPRLPHLAKLDFHCIQVECGLKNYSNDIVKVRQALGEEVCIFSNSHSITVVEQGDEEVWREDAHHQAKAIGKQKRFGIGHGTPTTWNTSPARYRRYIDFMRTELASIVPPH